MDCVSDRGDMTNIPGRKKEVGLLVGKLKKRPPGEVMIILKCILDSRLWGYKVD
jgi:hypothetical protein